jgi:hypothetical protein
MYVGLIAITDIKRMAIKLFHISNTDIRKSINFAYFHFIMKYGISLRGNSSYKPGATPRN